jgi:hypothetical protein
VERKQGRWEIEAQFEKLPTTPGDDQVASNIPDLVEKYFFEWENKFRAAKAFDPEVAAATEEDRVWRLFQIASGALAAMTCFCRGVKSVTFISKPRPGCKIDRN